MFGDDDDAEFGGSATLREAELLKQHSAVSAAAAAALSRSACVLLQPALRRLPDRASALALAVLGGYRGARHR